MTDTFSYASTGYLTVEGLLGEQESRLPARRVVEPGLYVLNPLPVSHGLLSVQSSVSE